MILNSDKKKGSKVIGRHQGGYHFSQADNLLNSPSPRKWDGKVPFYTYALKVNGRQCPETADAPKNPFPKVERQTVSQFGTSVLFHFVLSYRKLALFFLYSARAFLSFFSAKGREPWPSLEGP